MKKAEIIDLIGSRALVTYSEPKSDSIFDLFRKYVTKIYNVSPNISCDLELLTPVSEFIYGQINELGLEYDGLVAMDTLADGMTASIVPYIAQKASVPMYIWKEWADPLTGHSKLYPYMDEDKLEEVKGTKLLPIGLNCSRSVEARAVYRLTKMGFAVTDTVTLFKQNEPIDQNFLKKLHGDEYTPFNMHFLLTREDFQDFGQ